MCQHCYEKLLFTFQLPRRAHARTYYPLVLSLLVLLLSACSGSSFEFAVSAETADAGHDALSELGDSQASDGTLPPKHFPQGAGGSTGVAEDDGGVSGGGALSAAGGVGQVRGTGGAGQAGAPSGTGGATTATGGVSGTGGAAVAPVVCGSLGCHQIDAAGTLDCPDACPVTCKGPAGIVQTCCAWTGNGLWYDCGCPTWDQFGNKGSCVLTGK